MTETGTAQHSSDGDATPEQRRIRLAWRLMSYAGSYTAAWKRLLPGTVQLALPTLYLQRHTLELLLKEVLIEILAVRDQKWAATEILGLESSAHAVDVSDSRAQVTAHDLGLLSRIVNKNLAVLGLPLLPAAFDEVIALLDEVEEDSPERLRYATIRDKRTRQLVPSFSVPEGNEEGKTAQIDRIGELLTEISSWPSTSPLAALPEDAGRAAKMRFFYDSLSDGRDHVAGQIASALGELEAATRRGDVKWTVASHETAQPPADIMCKIDSPYFAASYRDKLIVLVPVGVSATTDSPIATGPCKVKYALSAEREDGSLLECIWLDDYRSELPQTIRDSLPEDCARTGAL